MVVQKFLPLEISFLNQSENGFSLNEASNSDPVLWMDERVFPFYATTASVAIGIANLLLRIRKKKHGPGKSFYSTVPALRRILLTRQMLELTRLVSGSALIGISLSHLVPEYKAAVLWLEIASYSYATILSGMGTMFQENSSCLSDHVSWIYFVSLVGYTRLEIVPLAHGDFQFVEWQSWFAYILLLQNGIVIPLCLPTLISPRDREHADNHNPRETASLISKLCYFYLEPLIWAGYWTQKVELKDLPPPLENERAEHLLKTAFPVIDPVISGRSGPWNLMKGLIQYHRKDIVVMLSLMGLNVASSFAAPIGILRILGYLEANDKTGLARPWAWIVWLALGPVIASMAFESQVWFRTHIRMRNESLFVQLIYHHALRVRLNTASTDSADVTKAGILGSNRSNPGARNSRTEGGNKDGTNDRGMGAVDSGAAINLVTVDVDNINAGLDLQGITDTLRTIVTFIFLYRILGWSSFVGIVTLLISLPIPAYLVKLRHGMQQKQMKMSDKRLQSVSQGENPVWGWRSEYIVDALKALNVLRMIKLFGWENRIEEKVTESRDEELRYIWKSGVLDIAATYVVDAIPIIGMIGTYGCFTLVMGLPLHASLLFSSISLFDALRMHMVVLSYLIPTYVKAKVSLDRLAAFLSSGELLQPVHNSAQASRSDSVKSLEVSIADAEFTWNTRSVEDMQRGNVSPRRNFRLHIEGELTFAEGKITLITGPTASGKTSLLMALLGEMVCTPTSSGGRCILDRRGGVAYAAQESWVFNATIRDNILFGSPYDEERYDQVVDQCGLEKDLSMLDAGDMTEVGEKGITLSGGQKARVTLARAVYSKAAIVLLDDILSALDVHTSQWIVDQCLAGDLLRGRTVLLVTHNILLGRQVANHIVVLGSNGRVHQHGNIEDVLQSNAELQGEILEEKKALEEAKSDESKSKEDIRPPVSSGKLVVEEEVAVGRVSWSSFRMYLEALGGSYFYVITLTTLTAHTVLPIIGKAFLAFWSSAYDKLPLEKVPVKLYLTIYGLILALTSIMGFTVYVIYLFGVYGASTAIHRNLLRSVLRSTFRWLDRTPVSRILTRFSQDVSTVDSSISFTVFSTIQFAFLIVANAATVVAASGWVMVIPALLVIQTGLLAGRVYMTAQLPIKRLKSNAKAPIIGQMQATMTGLVSVRAYGAQEASKAEMRARIDLHTKVGIPVWDLNRWIGLRIEVIGGLFSGILAGWLVYGSNSVAGTIGFSLTLVSNLNRFLLHWVRMFTLLEVDANSLERIRSFLMIDHEPEPSEDSKPPAYWPGSGDLKVENLSARYSNDGPEVLKHISIHISSGERVGVVGRTGAGKSSLALALLRAIPSTGTVVFDGIDTKLISLDCLRSRITVIPQNPELLSGTLRENIDPMGDYDDAFLNRILSATGLAHLRVEQGEGADKHEITLDSLIESGGSNLSQGQRQIIALARAFVRNSKILIMDEATSAIDYETDKLIQHFIRSEFSDVTVITIAHRLRTIMDSDKILVLDCGELAESGAPMELVTKEGSLFRSLVNESPDKDELCAMLGL